MNTPPSTGPYYVRNVLVSRIAYLRALLAAHSKVPGWEWRAAETREALDAAQKRLAAEERGS